jgi:hypothetical protein
MLEVEPNSSAEPSVFQNPQLFSSESTHALSNVELAECIKILWPYLTWEGISKIRMLNNTYLAAVKTAAQQQTPYSDKFAFTAAMTGYYKSKESYVDGLFIYFYTLTNYKSGKPILFYKKGEIDLFEQNGMYTHFADHEDPYDASRIYCPGLTPSEQHTWPTNATWLLAAFHLKAPAITYSALSIYRRNVTNQVSAFAREITAAVEVGYKIKFNFKQPRTIEFIQPASNTSIVVNDVNVSNEKVEKILTELMEQEKNEYCIEALASVAKQYLKSKKINRQVSFELLSLEKHAIAAKDKNIYLAYLILKIFELSERSQLAAALNLIERYVLEAQDVLAAKQDTFIKLLLERLAYLKKNIFSWKSSAKFDQATRAIINKETKIIADAQSYYEQSIQSGSERYYTQESIKASRWRPAAQTLQSVAHNNHVDDPKINTYRTNSHKV